MNVPIKAEDVIMVMWWKVAAINFEIKFTAEFGVSLTTEISSCQVVFKFVHQFSLNDVENFGNEL